MHSPALRAAPRPQLRIETAAVQYSASPVEQRSISSSTNHEVWPSARRKSLASGSRTIERRLGLAITQSPSWLSLLITEPHNPTCRRQHKQRAPGYTKASRSESDDGHARRAAGVQIRVSHGVRTRAADLQDARRLLNRQQQTTIFCLIEHLRVHHPVLVTPLSFRLQPRGIKATGAQRTGWYMAVHHGSWRFTTDNWL